MSALSFSLLAGLAALVYGAVLMGYVLARPQGDEKMRAISAAIRG